MGRWTDRWIPGQIHRETDGFTDAWMYGWMDIQIHRQMKRCGC